MEKEDQNIVRVIKKASVLPTVILICAVLFILIACILLALFIIFGWRLIYFV
jgi:hypothetical protein